MSILVGRLGDRPPAEKATDDRRRRRRIPRYHHEEAPADQAAARGELGHQAGIGVAKFGETGVVAVDRVRLGPGLQGAGANQYLDRVLERVEQRGPAVDDRALLGLTLDPESQRRALQHGPQAAVRETQRRAFDRRDRQQLAGRSKAAHESPR